MKYLFISMLLVASFFSKAQKFPSHKDGVMELYSANTKSDTSLFKPSLRLYRDSGQLSYPIYLDTMPRSRMMFSYPYVKGLEMPLTNERREVSIVEKGERVLTLYGDSSLVVNDSLLAIKLMLKYLIKSQDESSKQSARLYAAEEILQYVTLDGRVSDKKKFDIAVKEFQKLKNKKP